MTASEYRHNMPRAFKTKYEENESDDILITYLNGLNLYETSKNKAYINICRIAKQLILFDYEAAWENIFEVENLPHLKDGG